MSVARKIAAKNSDRVWLRSAFISAATARRRTRPTGRPRSSAGRARRRHASVLHLAVVGLVARLVLLRGAADRGEPPAVLSLLEELRLSVGELDHGVQRVHLNPGDRAGLEPYPGDRLAALALLLLLELRAGLRGQLRARTLAVVRLGSRREALGHRAHLGDVGAATAPPAPASDAEKDDRHDATRTQHPHGTSELSSLGLVGGGLAALAAGGLLLLARAALAAAALARRARARLLAAPARRTLRVGDRSRPALAHALLAQALVLLVVLHAGTVIFRHASRVPRRRDHYDALVRHLTVSGSIGQGRTWVWRASRGYARRATDLSSRSSAVSSRP